MELKKIHISDIGKVVTGKTPRTSIVENYGGNIPFLTPSDDLSYKSVPKTSKTLTEQGLNEVKNCLLPPHSVCVSCIGSDLGKVVMTLEPTITNQQFNSIIPNRQFNTDFVYYLMTLVGKELNYLSKTSTAVPIINKSSFSNYEVEVPDLKKQEKIASILSSLDDKIELNRRINGNLEQQAQALFKAWFVDFEPFDKNTNGIPYNWEKISLSDIMDYSGGSQPPASEFINTYKDGYIRFIQIRDYASNSHITYIPISPRNKLCQKEDIMIARYGASLGRICYGLEGAYNVALAKVIPKRPYYREFLRCYLSCNDFYEGINKKGNRAVQAGFNQSDINSFELWFPQDNNILERFDEICHNLFKARMYNDEENERLSKLRDTLLPRLMSGELYVNTITE